MRRILILLVLLSGSLSATVRNVKTTCGATGNGTTDDTAAINTCIGQLVSGDTLLFPAGTYKTTSSLNPITVASITVDGSSSAATVKGAFSGGVLFQVGAGLTVPSYAGGAAPGGVALLANAAALSTSFQTTVSSLGGLNPGDLVIPNEGGVDPATATTCDISGCRGEVLKVASVSGNTVTVTTALHFDYNTANVAAVYKMTGVVSGCNVHDIILDGSGTVSTGLEFLGTDSCTATNITAQNFAATAMQGYRNWAPSWNSITVTHAGTNGGACAANLFTDGNASINGLTLSSLNTGAFGMCFSQGGAGTFAGVNVNKSGSGTGRAVKTIGRAYSTWNNLTVANTNSGYNGMDFEYYSAHDTVNTCNFTANSTGGIVTFGNYNDFLTLNSCTMVVGANGSEVGVSQALSGGGRRDQNLTISGGTYSGTSGFEVIQCGGNNCTVENAQIGPATQGIAVIVSGLSGLCFNNNTFAAGMSYAYAANSGTGFANGNALNGNSVISPLPTGACGGGPLNYYVATTGSDSNTPAQAQNPATPWATITHADAALTQGTTGTFVNVAAGTYNGDVSTAQTGTSTSRVTYVSTTPYGAHIVGNGSSSFLSIWHSTGDYQTIQGFDITGVATEYFGILFASSHGRAVSNKIHDMLDTACPGNGGAGVADAGAIGSFSDNGAIGNLIIGIGTGTTGCNSIHGIYWNYPGDIAQNNIIGNVKSGQCISSYHAASRLVITQNTVFACQNHGILLSNSLSSNTQSTVANNLSVNLTGFSVDCLSGLTSPNQVSSNGTFGSSGIGGGAIGNCTVTGTFSTDPLFVNYQASGLGDYHLQSGSPARSAGNSTCVAGGITPCIPPTDFSGVVRPTGGTQDVGAYVFVSTGVPVATFSPSPLSFGTVGIGIPSSPQASTLTNSGGANLVVSAKSISGTNAGDFSETDTCGAVPFTLTAGSSCTFNVTFTPSAAGARSANVTITDNASGSPHQLPLSGTGGSPAATVTPSSLTFPVTPVGSCSATQMATLNSTGTSPLTVTSAFTFTGDFGFGTGATNPCSVGTAYPPGQSCNTSIQFCPTASGTRNGTLSFNDNAPGAPQVLPLTGTGGGVAATLTPSSAACGSQQVGTSSTCQAFTLTSTGNLNLTGITISFTGTGATSYSQSNNCPLTQLLVPGNSCLITVSFVPKAAGSLPASLSVASNSPTSPNTSTLSGTGLTPPTIVLSPATINFGNVLVGSTPTPTPISVTNNGGTAATISSITTASPFSLTSTCPISPATLAAAGVCTINVTVTPTVLGAANGTVTVSDNAAGSPHAAQLSVNGVAPGVSFSPTSLAFGNQAVGSQSAQQNLSFTNNGTGPLQILSVGLAGSNPGDFSIGTNTCSTSTPLLSDSFNTGTLNASLWAIDTGPSPAPGPGNTGSFSTANVSLSQGMLDLVLTQAAGSPIISTGAEVRSLSNYSYGTYVATFRASSTSTTPAGAGTERSGSVSSSFSFINNSQTEIDSPEFEGQGAPPGGVLGCTAGQVCAEFTNWNGVSNHTFSGGTFVSTGDSAQHAYKWTWLPNVITFSVDGSLQYTSVTNIPSTAAAIIFNHYGTNSTGFGGLATTGVTRHQYISGISFIPATALAAGASCTIGVNFKPTTSGARAATVSAVDSASGSPHTAALTGTGTALTVTIAPSSLTFASTTVGQTTAPQGLTFTNTGNIILNIASIAASGDFAISSTTCGSTLAASANCAVNATFTPTATGARTGAITFTDNAIGSPQTAPLSGTGTAVTFPVATITPSSLTFSSQTVGTTSGSQAITLHNTGTATLNIASILASGDYAISSTTCGSTLAASASCTVNVTFTPTATGTRTGAITFTDNASGSPQVIALTGTGTAPTAPIVSLSPTSLTFPSTFVGQTSASQDITLSNTGNTTLTIASIVASGDFARTTTCGATLAQAANCLIHVTFTPTAAGTRSGAITITDNAAGSPQSVPLSGVGIATAPAVSLSVTSINFGNQPVGTNSATHPIVVTNTGTANLIVSGITPTGNFSETDNCTTVIPGGTCTINGTFSPLSAGTLTGQFSIADNAANTPQLVSLQGFGTQTGASLTPSTLAFGNVTVGQPSASMTLTLSNTGNTSLGLNAPTMTGTNPGDFSLPGACGATLAPNGSCTYGIVFTPGGAGARSATFTQPFSNGVASVTSSLTGTGIAAVSGVGLNPASINFGNVTQGVTSSPVIVQVTNTGNAVLNITSITLTGTNAADYAIVNSCGSTLAVGRICTVSVTVTPGGLGARTANLHLIDDAPNTPQNVAMTVNGVSAPAPAITLSPTSLSFSPPTISIGQTSAAQSITATNTGNAPLVVSNVALGGTSPQDFIISNTCGTVASGASCSATVNCQPVDQASVTATAIFTSNAPTSPDTVTLSCTGHHGHGKATVGVSAINFNNQTVGTTSGPAVFTVTNTGDAVLNVSTVTTTGNFADVTSCSCCIAISASCSVSVTFTPGQLCGQFDNAGNCISNVHLGQVAVNSDDPASPAIVTLQGTALPIPPPPGPITVTLGGVLVVGGHLRVGVQ